MPVAVDRASRGELRMFGWNSLSLWRSPRLRSLLPLPPLAPRSTRLEGSRWSHGAGDVRAVIFDMGGVILPSPYPPIQEWEAACGLPGGTVLRVLRDGGEANAWCRYQRGEMSPETFDELFGADCSRIAGRAVSVDGFVAHLVGQLATPVPGALAALRGVRERGVKTALLTNNFYVRGGATFLPLDRALFDVVVESCVVGMKKPDPRIYSLCLEELGVPPSGAVFLDDLGENLAPARALGLRTIKVGDLKVALAELESLLGFSLSHGAPDTGAVRAGLEIDERALAAYLRTALGLHADALLVRQFRHGQSNPTYYVECGDRKLVLRKKPPGKLLPSAHAVEREYRVMKALGAAGVPVPQVLSLCEDSSVLGTPFYLMEYAEGRIFKDPSLPDLSPEQRRKVYSAVTSVLSQIHRVDPSSVGLTDFGKTGRYVGRQVQTWTKQYRASETKRLPSMELLVDWLPAHLPREEATCVVHGDFRLDNLVFDAERLEVRAVLDWELSTLGDPLSDLSYSCLAHHLPRNFPILPGLKGCDLVALGIPSDEEAMKAYCGASGRPPVEDWHFYLAFSFFRVAAILQGVYKRALSGQASSARAEEAGQLAEAMADVAWGFATREGFRIFKGQPKPPGGGAPGQSGRPYSTSCRSTAAPGCPRHDRRFFAASAGEAAAASGRGDGGRGGGGGMPVREAELAPAARATVQAVRAFVGERVIPAEAELRRHGESERRWEPHPLLEQLKTEARGAGLWNLFLAREADPDARYGAGLTNVEYAFACEEMGRSLHASEAFNCSAPDTGNMEVLVRYGTDQQRRRWLAPLLDGKIRSCFAMTEPQVASSDATNIEASIVEAGDSYVLNGHKWWTSGALDPRCELCIFMGKTDPAAPRHQQQSMVLVPMDTPGLRVLRPLSVYGFQDPPGGHGELEFVEVRVPRDNVLLGPGRGFEIAQGRLGPGRVHHCMRLIGSAERALQLMTDRVKSRVAFGKPLAEQGTVMADMATSRVELEQARLLVLKTAHLMDSLGNKAAAPEIAMIKVVVPSMAQQVIDRAIQAFGAAGLGPDLPLAEFHMWARALRIADGPDEVHRATVAKMELRAPRLA
ncbi:unnamed protein product [Lampetra fluviatilis]